MRIAVITDVHANLPALESVVKDLKGQSTDALVFLGDLVMDGTRPGEVFDLLESLDPSVWILGNTDDWLSEIDDEFVPSNDLEKVIMERTLWAKERLGAKRIESLLNHSISREFEAAGYILTFCHGSPDSYSFGILPDKPSGDLADAMKGVVGEALICGHTHRRFMMRFGGRTTVNFGAVSIPGNDFSLDARYGIIELKKDLIAFRPRDCQYDTMSFLKEMAEFDYPDYKTIQKKFGKSGEVII
ncbi:MAG: metallophosphoesterase family protein [Spirochaetaceae bacterium]|nr:metallophosphoesterase family protein [Spirochaetaceae bacterium]